MEDTNDQGPFLLEDQPVYGPGKVYFWPGYYAHAEMYIADLAARSRRPVYLSGEEFLEMYVDEFFGVIEFRGEMGYPEGCKPLFENFYTLYNRVRSWDATTLFASALYRVLLHEMLPHKSRLSNLVHDSKITKLLVEAKDGYSEGILFTYGTFVREGDKLKRNLSFGTCSRLMGFILYSHANRPPTAELMAMLRRIEIVATHQRELAEGLICQTSFSRQ